MNLGSPLLCYSSPHLVQVRERIRINGLPIEKDLFTKYFWQVYSRLDETKVGCGLSALRIENTDIFTERPRS